MIDDQMKFEAERPVHRPLSMAGNTFKHFISFGSNDVANLNLGRV
nr:hypothetical protein [Vibrio navarrensis]